MSMDDSILQKVKRRNRQKSVALSDELIEKIKEVTKGASSVSSFIRLAIIEKLEQEREER